MCNERGYVVDMVVWLKWLGAEHGWVLGMIGLLNNWIMNMVGR